MTSQEPTLSYDQEELITAKTKEYNLGDVGLNRLAAWEKLAMMDKEFPRLTKAATNELKVHRLNVLVELQQIELNNLRGYNQAK